MSHYHSLQNARTEAFYRLPETCPEVRIQIGKAIKEVIEGTDTIRADLEPRDIESLISDLIMSITPLNPSDLVPFSLDHLLLAGLIIDRGQLDSDKRVELNRRTLQGTLIHEGRWKLEAGEIPLQCLDVWRLPHIKARNILNYL